jgi:hypothetical protein
MARQRFKVHPAADIFPMMDAETYEGLKADIAANGQNESIVFWCEQLLDGRNRLKACNELGIEPETCELPEDADPFAYVVSANLHRRHLAHEQRSAMAATMATMKQGGDRKSSEIKTQNCVLIDEAAKLFNVSPRSVVSAKHVKENGSKELFEALKQGEVKVGPAEQLCKVVPDKAEQTAVVKQGKKAVSEKIKEAKEKTPPKTRKAKAHDVEPEPEYEDIDEPESCKWDMAVINTFRKCECRLGTLRQLLSELSETEIQILKDWLAS